MECQRNKGLEAPGLVLQFAEPQQMIRAVIRILDMPVEHGGVAPQAEFMRRSMNPEPLVGVCFVFADLVANLRMEDFCTTSWQTSQANVLELFEDVTDRTLGEMTEPVDLHWRPSLEMQARAVLMQLGNDVAIPLIGLLVMQSTDDMHLRATTLDRFTAPREDLLIAHDIATVLTEIRPKRAERAAIDADIRWIEVRIDVVVATVAVLPLTDQVGQLAKFVQVDRLIPQALSLRRAEPLTSLNLFPNRTKRLRHAANHDFTFLFVSSQASGKIGITPQLLTASAHHEQHMPASHPDICSDSSQEHGTDDRVG